MNPVHRSKPWATRPAFVLVAVATWLLPTVAMAAPAVVAADIRIVMTSPLSCEVTMAFRVDEATRVEHRIESFDGAVVDIDEIRGATQIAGPQPIGRTRSMMLGLEGPAYELRYRATQGALRRDRCPIWVPTLPSTGQLGMVRMEVRLPAAAAASTSMPALAWSGNVGTTTLAHVPAFVRISYGSGGTPAAWDLPRVMDGLAVITFVAASGVWLWWRRQRWA